MPLKPHFELRQAGRDCPEELNMKLETGFGAGFLLTKGKKIDLFSKMVQLSGLGIWIMILVKGVESK